ncbi:hypothetical protein ACWGDX_13540 [Streptomyces sp. NPDC055025]
MTANPIERLDVPLTVVADQTTAYKRGRRMAGLTAEDRHLIDPADTAFAALACEHPNACSTNASYPNWTPGRAA